MSLYPWSSATDCPCFILPLVSAPLLARPNIPESSPQWRIIPRVTAFKGGLQITSMLFTCGHAGLWFVNGCCCRSQTLLWDAWSDQCSLCWEPDLALSQLKAHYKTMLNQLLMGWERNDHQITITEVPAGPITRGLAQLEKNPSGNPGKILVLILGPYLHCKRNHEICSFTSLYMSPPFQVEVSPGLVPGILPGIFPNWIRP